MEALSLSAAPYPITKSQKFSSKTKKTHFYTPAKNLKFPSSQANYTRCSLSYLLRYSLSCVSPPTATRASATSTSTPSTSFPLSLSSSKNRHWMVIMEKPPEGLSSKSEIVDYYVKTLERVLGSEMDAQMCIYHTSCRTHFGFCCVIDEEVTLELARVPGVLSVRPDPDYDSADKDYSFSNIQPGPQWEGTLFPSGTTKQWLVRMDKPGVGVVTKAQMVDFYVQILTKVLGNEKDAQMCIYHVSWQSNFGFCCELDEQCAQELAGVPGVLSVEPDNNFESENKDYAGNNLQKSKNLLDSLESNQAVPLNPRKLFVTGLSFYTSEKTLRAAFEGFGELVGVKVIMDKISKRSKGYAFVEYTTEEAANVALKEMNGKIINGWMIVVDYAKSNPRGSRSNFSRSHPRGTV